ncbi:MAG: hypothetical protein WAM39_22455 [Bryobacteraceae bacterium]
MKSHLTSEQISDWALGTRSRPVARHIHSCPVCRKEINRFEEALVHFRTSVREWTACQFDPHFQIQCDRSERHSGTAVRTAWALTALVLCLVVSLAVHRGPRQGDELANDGDNALLNQVDQEVARTVPGPMEPLLRLVAWDGNSVPETAGDGADR